MPDTTAKQARIAAERLCEIIHENPIRVSQTVNDQCLIDIDQTISIGVAIFDGSHDTTDTPNVRIADLLDRADAALYRAKSAGRNQVTFSKSAA